MKLMKQIVTYRKTITIKTFYLLLIIQIFLVIKKYVQYTKNIEEKTKKNKQSNLCFSWHSQNYDFLPLIMTKVVCFENSALKKWI